MIKRALAIFPLLVLIVSCNSQHNSSKEEIYATKPAAVTIAFYNVENLFDTVDDPGINDGEFTPYGRLKWSEKRFQKKINSLARTIAKIGREQTKTAPALVGLAEIENLGVLEDLVATSALKEHNYQIIHKNSSDTRGIDVALIYNPKLFKPELTELISIPSGSWKTREILKVTGKLMGRETVTICVNHWPSRRGGVKETEFKRLLVAQTLKQEIESGSYVVMGDFNDSPQATAIEDVLKTEGRISDLDPGEFYNPFEQLAERGKGTLVYKGKWLLFDQILLSSELIQSEGIEFKSAEIYNSKELLQQQKNKYRGFPNRTYAGPNYIGGPSDHLPVYVLLNVN